MVEYKYPTLYGGRTDNPVGHCYLHKKALTVRQLKKHECLRKQCTCLKRYDQHPFWARRAQRKEWRQQRRTAMTGGTDALRPTETSEAGG